MSYLLNKNIKVKLSHHFIKNSLKVRVTQNDPDSRDVDSIRETVTVYKLTNLQTT